MGHRTSRPVRLANGHAQHSQGHRPWENEHGITWLARPGALPQAMMSIAVGEKTGYRIWAIEHHDRIDWPTAMHNIARGIAPGKMNMG
ncbi:MAG: hypothetical protein ACK5GD_02515 [Planctomycetota bacterium]